MSRIQDTMLDQKAFGKGHTNPMLDLNYGGQFGYAPNLSELVNNQAYVRGPLIAILMEAPRFFGIMPDSEKWYQTLKALVERHPKSIEGFNAEITVDIDEHAVGGGGEFQQEITDVKRARSEPTFSYTEKYGAPIQMFLENWIRYGMSDPETKYALAGTLEKKPDDMLLDWYSMTCLFIEPNPTHNKVVRAWLSTNMFPKGTGEIVGKRDLTTAKEIVSLSIPFTATSQYGLGVNVLAQKILDSLNIRNANPFHRASFIDKIDSEVEKPTNGYNSSIEAVSKSIIPGL